MVATTASLPSQAVEELQAEAAGRLVRFVALDWPTAGFPPLAAALVAGREAVAAEFPSIAAALATLTAHPHCAEAVEALRGQMAGDAPGWPVYDPSLVYRRGRSPTALLDARYRIVPLMNRDNDVAEWSDWARGTLGTQGARSGARVLTGDGGMGKTRLLMEICRGLRADGWRTGFLREGAVFTDVRRLAGAGNSLIVVDYAELRARELNELCRMLLEFDALDRVRLVLLARNAGRWLTELADDGAAASQVLGMAGRAEPILLSPTAPAKRAARQRDRASFVVAAARAFGAAEGMDAADAGRRLADGLDLARPEFDRVLLLLAEVWRAVFMPGHDGPDPWMAVLRRERAYLVKLDLPVKPRAVMQALAWVGTNGGAATRRGGRRPARRLRGAVWLRRRHGRTGGGPVP